MGLLGMGCGVEPEDDAGEPALRVDELLSAPGGSVIATGGESTCAIVLGGLVKCWGDNASGQLGQGNTTDLGATMGDGLPFVNLGTGRTAKSIVMGWGNVGAFACAILNNNQVKCWGDNAAGQLGLGNTSNRGDQAGEMGDSLPVVDLGTGRTARALAAHGTHVCALLDNNQVKCWGNNAAGQLGQGDVANRGDGANEMGNNLAAVNLGSGRTAKAIATGFLHSCAILDNDTVKCWGYNEYAALGLGHITPMGGASGDMAALPTVNLGTGRTAKAIAAGGERTCVILDNNTVKCWGKNVNEIVGVAPESNLKVGDETSELGNGLATIALGTSRTAKALGVGQNHTCVILDNNTVKCWGFNLSGQLGLGDTASRGYNTTDMGNNLSAVSLGTGRTARAIAAGKDISCTVLDNNRAKCWGRGASRALGTGATSNVGDASSEMGNNLQPINVGSRSVLSAAAGSAHTCALFQDGAVTCWGSNSAGQIGVSSIPVGSQVLSFSGFTIGLGSNPAWNVVAGTAHTCARLSNEQLKCWGANASGQLGLGDTTNRSAPASSTINLGTNTSARAVVAAGDFTCAILGNSHVKCWGENGSGQLGSGNTTDLTSPPSSTVALGSSLLVSQIALGKQHACALLSNNRIRCWGANGSGQLGLGDVNNRGDGSGEMGDSLPTVDLGTGFTPRAVAAGNLHTCAISSGNQVKCWGDNSAGQLGLGDTSARGNQSGEMGNSLPVLSLGTGRTAKSLALGGTHTCVILDNDQMKCWGGNGTGQLGIGDFSNRGDGSGEMGDSLPNVNVTMTGGLVATNIFAGESHTCALLSSTQLSCWGGNSSGQLGSGSTSIRNRPFTTPVDLGSEP